MDPTIALDKRSYISQITIRIRNGYCMVYLSLLLRLYYTGC